jgi:hypothetical protein
MGGSSRKVSLVVSLAVASIGVLAGALVLAINAYHAREMREHREVLQKFLDRHPSVSQLEAEVDWEFYRAARPTDARELSTLWDSARNSPRETEEKISKWPDTRVYLNRGMVYFIYFDSHGVMRDFSILSN